MPDMTDSSPNTNNEPILSILLPTFNYREGIHRILTRLHPLPETECELLIYDNSPNDEIELEALHWQSVAGMPVSYNHHAPSVSPAANWNGLLNKARGKYCLLMHHDEFPLSDNFIRDLIQQLRENPDTDVLMLDCILVNPKNARSRRHLPSLLRLFATSRFPYYLLRRNVIGPTASLVIRRELYPRFDSKLRWLLDVDVYVRLLERTKRIKICPKIHIGSIWNRPDSITKSLGRSIRKIESSELAYLQDTYHTNSFWLGPVGNKTFLQRILLICEAFCWYMMRIVTRIPAIFCFCPVSRSAVKKVL